MNQIINKANLSFIESAISYASLKLRITNLNESLWNIYGSYVINRHYSNSDLDITVFSGRFLRPERHVFVYKNVPIHLTAVPVTDLIADGEKREYGGYFTGKIINPHIFLYGNRDLIKTAQVSAGKFIGNLAGYIASLTGNKLFNQGQITCHVFLAYLSTDPSFDSYFLSYYAAPNFIDIWKALCKTTIETLLVSKTVKNMGNKFTYSNPVISYHDFHEQRMRIAARHWSFGAIYHGNNFRFYDEIFENAERKMKHIDPSGVLYKKLLSFFKENSGLNEVYI